MNVNSCLIIGILIMLLKFMNKKLISEILKSSQFRSNQSGDYIIVNNSISKFLSPLNKRILKIEKILIKL